MRIMGEEITGKKGMLILGLSIAITLLLAIALSSIKPLNLGVIPALIVAAIVYLGFLILGYIFLKNSPNRVEHRHGE